MQATGGWPISPVSTREGKANRGFGGAIPCLGGESLIGNGAFNSIQCGVVAKLVKRFHALDRLYLLYNQALEGFTPNEPKKFGELANRIGNHLYCKVSRLKSYVF